MRSQGYFYEGGFGTHWQSAAGYTVTYNIDPTDADAWEDVAWSPDDVDVFVVDYGDVSWYGETYCHTENGGVCHRWIVQFNQALRTI